MQNSSLLKAAGRAKKAVLLKRGMAATIEELLLSAEYVLAEGNHDVILCERGIRGFDTATRNVFDLTAIPVVHKLSHLPIIADPSRAIGITLSLSPVPCDGSAMIGRCESLCTTGIAVRSNTLRVDGSKPRMPRSHRITSRFPSDSTYPAERSSSSIVAAIPRFNSTGFLARPATLSSEKFCMF